MIIEPRPFHEVLFDMFAEINKAQNAQIQLSKLRGYRPASVIDQIERVSEEKQHG